MDIFIFVQSRCLSQCFLIFKIFRLWRLSSLCADCTYMLVFLCHLPALSSSVIFMPCSVFCLLLQASSLVSVDICIHRRCFFSFRKHFFVRRHYLIWQLSRFISHLQSWPHGLSAAGRISSMKTVGDPIGNRTRDLPACSEVRLHSGI